MAIRTGPSAAQTEAATEEAQSQICQPRPARTTALRRLPNRSVDVAVEAADVIAEEPRKPIAGKV